jgi:hypothetical protein
VHRAAAAVLSMLGFATVMTASVSATDDFPLVGTYTENEPCEGAGANVSRVTISPTEIDSVFGLCSILDIKQDGNTFRIHIECKGAGGSQMLGDVSFTPRDDKTLDFSDQDQTYKAVLYKCP